MNNCKNCALLQVRIEGLEQDLKDDYESNKNLRNDVKLMREEMAESIARWAAFVKKIKHLSQQILQAS